MKDTMQRRFAWLQLFAEGGEDGGDAGASGTDTGASGAEGAPNTDAADADAGAGKASFDELLQDNDYRAEFDRRVKAESENLTRSSLDGRFKAAKANADRVKALEPIMGVLAQRYGTDDAQGILDALGRDNAWAEDQAAEAGMSTESFLKMRGLEQELAIYRQQEKESEVQRQWQALLSESETLRAEHPDFDLKAEMEGNAQFARLVASLQSNGFENPLQQAYRMTHFNDIVTQREKSAAQAAREQVAASVRAGQARPSENGAGAAASTAYDPGNLSDAQREEIRERVRRGEKITFR